MCTLVQMTAQTQGASRTVPWTLRGTTEHAMRLRALQTAGTSPASLIRVLLSLYFLGKLDIEEYIKDEVEYSEDLANRKLENFSHLKKKKKEK